MFTVCTWSSLPLHDFRIEQEFHNHPTRYCSYGNYVCVCVMKKIEKWIERTIVVGYVLDMLWHLLTNLMLSDSIVLCLTLVSVYMAAVCIALLTNLLPWTTNRHFPLYPLSLHRFSWVLPHCEPSNLYFCRIQLCCIVLYDTRKA